MVKQRDGDDSGDIFAEALTRAMRTIGRQIAREMQRFPAEQEVHGVQKWAPIQKRVERAIGIILDEVGDQTVEIESLVVLTRAFTSAIRMIVEDLGVEGLGKVRSEYVCDAMERAQEDARRTISRFLGDTMMN
jgi:hypothetical protein